MAEIRRVETANGRIVKWEEPTLFETPDNVILKVLTGSKSYGTDTPESDNDYITIYVESPEQVFSYSTSTGKQSVSASEDETVYSLRHFLHLCMKGNPNTLCVLWSDTSLVEYIDPVAKPLYLIRDWFITGQSYRSFIGYLKNQRDRFAGDRTGHTPNRPDLVEEFGYDCKYASQAARLALQGIELFADKHISLPLKEDDRAIVRDIRRGLYSYEDALNIIDSLLMELENTFDASEFPDKPDPTIVWETSSEIHLDYWGFLERES